MGTLDTIKLYNINVDENFIILCGTAGTGKTFIGNLIARKTGNRMEHIHSIKNRLIKNNMDIEAETEFNALTLCIDDILPEDFDKVTIWGNSYNLLEEILLNRLDFCEKIEHNHEYFKRYKTIITTNLNIDELKKLFSGRLLSRMKKFAKVYNMAEFDLRSPAGYKAACEKINTLV